MHSPLFRSTGLDDQEFAERLLREEHVAVVPGSVFGQGASGHLRCAYAVSRNSISEAIKRIETVHRRASRVDPESMDNGSRMRLVTISINSGYIGLWRFPAYTT